MDPTPDSPYPPNGCLPTTAPVIGIDRREMSPTRGTDQEALKTQIFQRRPVENFLARSSSPCNLARIPRKPTLKEISVTNTLTALVAATLATAAAAVATTADARCAGCLAGAGEMPPEAPPGEEIDPELAALMKQLEGGDEPAPEPVAAEAPAPAPP